MFATILSDFESSNSYTDGECDSEGNYSAIFCGVSTDEFHRILHVKTAKEAWTILETTYEGTKKVKDTKLQMLTLDLKSTRWVTMSLLIHSMGSTMKL